MKKIDYVTNKIETKRLVLKRGFPSDFYRVYEYDYKELSGIEEGVCKFKKNNLTSLKKLFEKGVVGYYDKCKESHMFDWIIYLDEEPIGNIMSKDEDLNTMTVSLVYNLHPLHWGKGYMPEALEGAINYLFKIGYDNIVCGYLDGNKKAKRVLEKLNFKPYKIKLDAFETKLGESKDSYDLIMTKEDWLSRTQKLEIIKLKD